MAKITAVAENVKVEDATVEETVTPVEDVVVEPEETIDSDFSVDNTEESYDEDVMPLPSGEEDATPVYNGDVAQQSSETIGKKWNEYTTGTDLDDTDELMVLDTSAKANKRTLLSKLADYVLGKLADKVFEKLETQNKTILGALNELNSKAFFTAKVSTNDKDTICVIPKDTSHFSFMAFGDYNTSYFYAFASLSAQISSVGEGSIKYANGRFEVKLSNWSYVSIISAMDFTCEVK